MMTIENLYIFILVLLVPALPGSSTGEEVFLPLNTINRQSVEQLTLTGIGQFGMVRKARPTVPSHYHTGIDMKRPGHNYINESVFPIAKGVVISKRTDGPYGQVIIEHELQGRTRWTVYEHIAAIVVGVGDSVDPAVPIARFFNSQELTRYGWQFDHVHFEILKVKPVCLTPDARNPDRKFSSYSLVCHSSADLQKYFFDPTEFFESSWSH